MSPAHMFRTLGAALDARPDHRRIVIGLFAVGGLAALARLVGAAKEIIVADRYGTGPTVDAYVFLSGVLASPAGVWVGVATAVVIPLLVRADLEDREAGLRFRRELWGFTICAGAAITLVAAAFLALGRTAGLALFGAIPDALVGEAAPLVLLLPLMMAFGLLAAFLMADRQHANTLLEATPAAAVIVGLLVWPSGGLPVLVIPTVVGLGAQVLLALVFQKRGRRVWKPAFAFRSPHWRVLCASAGIVAAGQALTALTSVFDQFAAAGLGPGANAALGYATRLAGLGTALGALAIARATLPVFSRLGVEDRAGQRRIARDMSTVMTLVGAAAALVGWFVAPMVVELLFQRGAFTAKDAALVTPVFRMSLIQLPFFFNGLVLVQQLASNGDYSAFLKIGVVNLVTKLAALAVLTPVLGLPGVALSTAVMYGVGRIYIGRLAANDARAWTAAGEHR